MLVRLFLRWEDKRLFGGGSGCHSLEQKTQGLGYFLLGKSWQGRSNQNRKAKNCCTSPTGQATGRNGIHRNIVSGNVMEMSRTTTLLVLVTHVSSAGKIIYFALYIICCTRCHTWTSSAEFWWFTIKVSVVVKYVLVIVWSKCQKIEY